MVLLSAGEDEDSCKAYLTGENMIPVIEACVEAMLTKYSQRVPGEKLQPPLVFMSEWLKENNPRRSADPAAKLEELRAQMIDEAQILFDKIDTDKARAHANANAGTALLTDPTRHTCSVSARAPPPVHRYAPPGAARSDTPHCSLGAPQSGKLVKRELVKKLESDSELETILGRSNKSSWYAIDAMVKELLASGNGDDELDIGELRALIAEARSKAKS